MKGFFVSDLHGRAGRYRRLFELIGQERPDAVLFGGDLLPNDMVIDVDMATFLETELFSRIRALDDHMDPPPQFFVIMGNDDPRAYEVLFQEMDKDRALHYVNQRSIPFDDLFIAGYSFIPPTPFLLKDWELYDVSRHLDVGAVSPEEGFRTVPVEMNRIKHRTIQEDLQELGDLSPPHKTIYMFHCPPYKTSLDRMDVDGRHVDHAPVDVHGGSIAIRRFIEERQPLLTLHGHIHESFTMTQNWSENIGRTPAYTAAHDDERLAVVRFDTDDLSKATRDIVPTD